VQINRAIDNDRIGCRTCRAVRCRRYPFVMKQRDGVEVVVIAVRTTVTTSTLTTSATPLCC
jgi:hypothetical protein